MFPSRTEEVVGELTGCGRAGTCNIWLCNGDQLSGVELELGMIIGGRRTVRRSLAGGCRSGGRCAGSRPPVAAASAAVRQNKGKLPPPRQDSIVLIEIVSRCRKACAKPAPAGRRRWGWTSRRPLLSRPAGGEAPPVSRVVIAVEAKLEG